MGFGTFQATENCLREDTLEKCFTFKKKEFYNSDENVMYAERLIEENLRFIDSTEYLDTMTLNPDILNEPERLFEALNFISENQAFEAPIKV